MEKETNKKEKKNGIMVMNNIESMIYVVRDSQIMLDRDLAMLYEVETKYLKRQVKRNIERFPEDFMFQLTKEEMSILRCQFGTSRWGGERYLPFAFTKNGVAMLSGVLNSGKAVDVNIKIMRAFTTMSRIVSINSNIYHRISSIEYHQIETDKRIDEVFKRLDTNKPKEGIFFNGQIFDSFVFIIDLIKKAKREIILIDNYVDETVLTMLDNRNLDVSATIYTAHFSEKLRLALEKHNSQYQPINIEHFNKSHDRFLIIDNDVYLIGGSIKDLGKKISTFVKLSVSKVEFLAKL